MLAAPKFFGTLSAALRSAPKPVVVAARSSSNQVLLPTHQTGDLLIVMGWGASGSAMPGYVSGSDWKVIPGAASGSRAYWTIATSSNHPVGSWNSASTMTSVTVRGHNNGVPIGLNSRFGDGSGGPIYDSGSYGGGYLAPLSGVPENSLMLHWYASTTPLTPTLAINAQQILHDPATYRRWLFQSLDNTYSDNILANNSSYEFWASATIEVRPPGSFTPLTATGGTITEVDGWRIHTFTSNGTFTVSALGSDNTLEYLVVGGGGGGGTLTPGLAGGGGGGGVLTGSTVITSGAFPVTVGPGGGAAQNGSNSAFGSFVAVGGGKGGHYNAQPAGSGGSGGGGGQHSGAGAAGTPGQGFGGGTAGSGGGGGGGGGAGGLGGNGRSTWDGGFGGIGKASSITGVETYYGGGGGGGGHSSSSISIPTGGLGGGGNGKYKNTTAPTSGAANTGGGGGGGGENFNSASGGSGIVIVRYRIAA